MTTKTCLQDITNKEVTKLVTSLLNDLNSLCNEISLLESSRGAPTVLKIATRKKREIVKKYSTPEMQSVLKLIINTTQD